MSRRVQWTWTDAWERNLKEYILYKLMIYKIKTSTKDEYRRALAGLIANKIVIENKKITFIDCMNHLSQYMFRRSVLDKVMDNLFLSRIEQPYDLVDILKSIHFNSFFQKSDVLLVSSYNKLIEELSDDREHVKERVMKSLERIEEKYNKEVVILDYCKKWATQYHLNV